MEQETQHDFENEDQFWQELDKTVSKECDTHSLIDDALRSYLSLTTSYPDFVRSDHDLRLCAYKLYSSSLFAQHADYIRRQFLHCLLEDDEASTLHITTTFLLSDARENEQTFDLLNEESVFPRLVSLIGSPKQDDEEGLHRQLMELMYEMARIQRINNDDLTCIDDNFICYLFDIIEQVSGNVDDPYHYPVIRVLLVLNEQFMVSAHDPTAISHNTVPLTNKVMKVLSGQGGRYKTFGENIILLLNREDETSLQLLTLKLLYLLFTTPPTYEYFYTNDLHVLVDILIRNLLDLPEEASALRHTYLRVLFPLLEHTQLKDPPHYKRDEIKKLLSVLVGGQYVSEAGEGPGVRYFEDVDDTTKRLVSRCQTVFWLKEAITTADQTTSPVDEMGSPTKVGPPALPAPRKLRKRTSSSSKGSGSGPYLMPQLESARQSSLSMAEMATQKEKPGIITPSRNIGAKQGLREAMIRRKERPPPPKARRSGWARLREQKAAPAIEPTEVSVADSAEDGSEDETLDAKLNQALIEERASRGFKKPPPTPKQRRWRGKRNNEETEERINDDPFREPGSFSTRLPSLVVPDIAVSVPENSPFSPPEQKTLSEQSPFSPPNEGVGVAPSNEDEKSDVSAKKSKRISSVSAALGQAQVQALQDLEQTLEHVTIKEDHVSEQQATTNTDTDHIEVPIVTPRAVLAPPGQAPMRGVPGPKMELERSPFLSDDEREDVEDFTNHGKPHQDRDRNFSTGTLVEESSEDEWN